GDEELKIVISRDWKGERFSIQCRVVQSDPENVKASPCEAYSKQRPDVSGRDERSAFAGTISALVGRWSSRLRRRPK
ncbi:hypothetical protein ABTC16_19745, partial [Acinetobacter baumannii]